MGEEGREGGRREKGFYKLLVDDTRFVEDPRFLNYYLVFGFLSLRETMYLKPGPWFEIWSLWDS